MKSTLDELTEGQRKLVQQFRKELDPELNSRHSDELLIRYLKAKNFDLQAAKKIFFVHLYNLTVTGYDKILDFYVKPEVAEKFESAAILGFAKDGSLIRFAGAGRTDFYGFIMCMSCFELCAYFTHIMLSDIKALKDESERTGKEVTEITYIIDLEDFALQKVMHKCVIEMGLDYTTLYQDCYPEIWSNILVVNVPKIFQKAFDLFKIAMRPNFLQKIKLADRDSTKDLLLKHVDENVLPAFLGGKRVDSNGDPMCKEFITFGGKIPTKFYSQNFRTPLSTDDPEVRLVNIAPRSMFNLRFAVKEPGTIFEMEARSENGSLFISALYKKFGPDPDNALLPGEFEYLDENSENFEYTRVSVEIRAQTHCTQEKAKVIFPWPGIYVLRFSNANSWFTSRKLYFKQRIIPPKKSNSDMILDAFPKFHSYNRRVEEPIERK